MNSVPTSVPMPCADGYSAPMRACNRMWFVLLLPKAIWSYVSPGTYGVMVIRALPMLGRKSIHVSWLVVSFPV